MPSHPSVRPNMSFAIYLGRYTHRVAIANSRLIGMDETTVSFRWRDYRHGNTKMLMALDAGEFIRRFLLHSLPDGFHRIRHYGFLANGCRRIRRELIRAMSPRRSKPMAAPPSRSASVPASILPFAPVAAEPCASLRHCPVRDPRPAALGTTAHNHAHPRQRRPSQARTARASRRKGGAFGLLPRIAYPNPASSHSERIIAAGRQNPRSTTTRGRPTGR